MHKTIRTTVLSAAFGGRLAAAAPGGGAIGMAFLGG